LIRCLNKHFLNRIKTLIIIIYVDWISLIWQFRNCSSWFQIIGYFCFLLLKITIKAWIYKASMTLRFFQECCLSFHEIGFCLIFLFWLCYCCFCWFKVMSIRIEWFFSSFYRFNSLVYCAIIMLDFFRNLEYRFFSRFYYWYNPSFKVNVIRFIN
jgi:hypothetical protein